MATLNKTLITHDGSVDSGRRGYRRLGDDSVFHVIIFIKRENEKRLRVRQ